MKYLKWHVWFIFTILILATLVLLIVFFLTENGWILIVTYIFAVGSGGYFGNELNKSRLGYIGNNKDIFAHDIISLRGILQQHNINKIEQIDMLINQINEEIPRLKLSEKFLKTFYAISTGLLIPMLTLMIKWLLDIRMGEYISDACCYIMFNGIGIPFYY